MKTLRAFLRWYYQILPLPGATLAAIVLFLLTEGLCMIFDWQLLQFGQIWSRENPLGGSLCMLGTALYAIYRVTYFNPIWRPGYRKWLSTLPWSRHLPLPEGPVMLVPQDLIPLALLTLGSLRLDEMQRAWYIAPLVFLGFWVVMSLATFSLVGPRWLAYAILLAGGGILRCASSRPDLAVVIGVCMVVATQWGHYLCISRFHEWDLSWNEKYGWDAILSGNQEAISDLQTNALHGWPHDQLSPDYDRFKLLLSPLAGAQLALLVTWYFDSFMTIINENAWQPLTFAPLASFVCAVAAGFSGIRTAIYVSGHASPIGLFGRLATGRLIIPGYDQIFVAPLTLLVLASGGAYLLHELNAPPITSASGLLFLVILLATTMPPDLAEFHFIGSHRIHQDMTQRTSPHLIRE